MSSLRAWGGTYDDDSSSTAPRICSISNAHEWRSAVDGGRAAVPPVEGMDGEEGSFAALYCTGHQVCVAAVQQCVG